MNGNLVILGTALLPVVILIYYIYRKDRLAQEPAEQLIKAFLLGLLSVPLSLFISLPIELIGLVPAESVTVIDSIMTAFFGAAIPEETAKLVILWLLLRKNRYFDEKMDGIVYSVCVSLGFAALENVMYLFSDPETFLAVGVSRAIFAVPGHFCFGILMGYYYSLARFYPNTPRKNRTFVLVAPIIAHGLYDSILFVCDVTPALSGLIMVAFLLFCHRMWKYADRRIMEHIQRDAEDVVSR